MPRETAAVSAQVLCITYTSLQCHFIQSRIGRVCVFICNLSPALWQNDRGLLRATAVTRGWNGHRNESQHRKSTPENILPPLLRGLEPGSFQSRGMMWNDVELCVKWSGEIWCAVWSCDAGCVLVCYELRLYDV